MKLVFLKSLLLKLFNYVHTIPPYLVTSKEENGPETLCCTNHMVLDISNILSLKIGDLFSFPFSQVLKYSHFFL